MRHKPGDPRRRMKRVEVGGLRPVRRHHAAQPRRLRHRAPVAPGNGGPQHAAGRIQEHLSSRDAADRHATYRVEIGAAHPGERLDPGGEAVPPASRIRLHRVVAGDLMAMHQPPHTIHQGHAEIRAAEVARQNQAHSFNFHSRSGCNLAVVRRSCVRRT
jgi:hypothetical protein